MDQVSRQGWVIDQNVSVNGGTDKTQYYFSYNYYNNHGMLVQSDLIRHTVRLNLDQEFSKRFKAGIKLTYSNVNSGSTSTGSVGKGDNMLSNVTKFAPDRPVYNEDGSYSNSYNQLINNPASYKDVDDNTLTQRIFIAPTAELKIIDGLSLKGSVGYDRQYSTRKFYIPAKANHKSVPDGLASLGTASATNISVEGFLQYNKMFKDIHRVSAVLGAGYYNTFDDGFNMGAYDFFTDAFGYDNISLASNKEKETISSWRNERTKLSQFFRLNYSLLDRYVLTITARRDGSSYFSENHKWAIFPSASIAWRISEESFMKDKTPFSDLKLRIGYGAAGNENVLGTNSMAAYVNKSGSHNYNVLFGKTEHIGLSLARVTNPDLKWETDYTLNVGLDFGFLNSRIRGSVEFFHRGAKDLLDYAQLPSNNAVGRMPANIGETKSQGFEFTLSSENIKTKSFTWNTDFNLSYFKASWVKRNPQVALAEYIGEKDEIDEIYGWKTDGIIRSKDEIPSYMSDAKVGNIKYVDINNDGVLDSKDVVKLGNSTPKWMAGFNNTFTFKGFDLNFYFYGAFGFMKYRGQTPDASALGNAGSAPGNTWATVITEVYNSQTGLGWMPGIAANPYDSSNPSGTSDFYLRKGDYVKLKNVTLGYTLPQGVFAKSNFIKGLRFFIDAQNLLTITSYEGFDPELSVDLPYPQAVSLSFGFNLSF